MFLVYCIIFYKKDLLSFYNVKPDSTNFFLDKLSTFRHSPFCFFVMRKVSPLRFKKRLCLVFILYNTPCFGTKKSVLSVFNPLMLTNYKYQPTLWRIERLLYMISKRIRLYMYQNALPRTNTVLIQCN